MALDTVPFTTFRFEVVIDLDDPPAGLEGPLCRAAFAEADGLEMSMQPKTVEVGGVNDRQVHLIGPVTYGTLTLKRGMTDDLQLWSWFAEGTRPGSVHPAQVQVTLMAEDGTPRLRFDLTHALPTKMRAPSLNARDGLVAIEELSLAYAQLSVGPPGGGAAGFSAGFSAGIGFSAGASASASASFSASASASTGVSLGGAL